MKPSSPDSSWSRWQAMLLLVLLACALPVAAQDGLESHPGFFDFSSLVSDREHEVSISIKGPMIRLLAGTTRESDPDLSSLLSSLEAIEVAVYKTDASERDGWRRKIDRAARSLNSAGWAEAMTIRVQRDYGNVFLKLDGDSTVGLAAMYIAEDNETFFVNIVGEIDLARIGHLASRYNLDFLTQGQLSLPDSDEDSSKRKNAEAEPGS